MCAPITAGPKAGVAIVAPAPCPPLPRQNSLKHQIPQPSGAHSQLKDSQNVREAPKGHLALKKEAS